MIGLRKVAALAGCALACWAIALAAPVAGAAAAHATAGSDSRPGAAAAVDAPPLVSVQTMTSIGDRWGVFLRTYSETPLKGCPRTIETAFGTDCFYPDPESQGGTPWVQLLVLNRHDLSLEQNVDLYCEEATKKPREAEFDWNGNHCNAELSNFIGKLNSSDLVIAVNQPGTEATKKVMPPVGVGAVLAGTGRNNGIGIAPTWWDRRQSFPPAVRGTVSAIGVPGWKSGGVSKQSEQPDMWQSGRFSADLVMSNAAIYKPVTRPEKDAGEDPSPINKVLFQPPTPWPVFSRQALCAIGEEVGLGPHPRAAFYSRNLNWAEVRGDVAKVRFAQVSPSPSCGYFWESEFNEAQRELDTEIGWVIKVERYVDDLARPYKKAGAKFWASFNYIAAEVNSATSNGQSEKVTATAKSVIGALLDASHVVKPISKAGSIIAVVYRLALELADSRGGSSEEPFQVQAADLGRELTERLDDAENEISTRWRNIIVADYGKLKTVGLCAPMLRDCPDRNDGWDISVNEQTHMETALKLSLERTLYEGLVPAKYHLLMQLGRDTVPCFSCVPYEDLIGLPLKSKAENLKNWCGPVPPFDNETGAWLIPSSKYANHVHVYILTNEDDWQAARRSVFERMFEPIDPGGSFNQGGLGIDEDKFFRRNYFDKDRFHYSSDYGKWASCGLTGWYPLFG